MPQTALTNLGINFDFNLGSDGWKAPMDSNLQKLDGLVQPTFISSTTSTPPGAPAAGDAYIVGPAPTGAWAGRAGEIALFGLGTWLFIAPRQGWRVYLQSDQNYYIFETTWRIDQSLFRVITEPASSHAFSLGDAHRIIRSTTVSASTITIPLNASVPFPIGTQIWIIRASSATLTLAAAGGVIVNSAKPLAIATQFEGRLLIKVATDTWDVL